ncbi:hypothetical protein KPH14_006549 [Odynerus spinipes]|uniref:Uncharacterized protein n=1 Tax=Odynerus spinipes TaxID=1348599 RepID=A0AAD9RRN4_9HYME|nr:hypothetical protein KPH14_006549 [Odynerus spinipes]
MNHGIAGCRFSRGYKRASGNSVKPATYFLGSIFEDHEIENLITILRGVRLTTEVELRGEEKTQEARGEKKSLENIEEVNNVSTPVGCWPVRIEGILLLETVVKFRRVIVRLTVQDSKRRGPFHGHFIFSSLRAKQSFSHPARSIGSRSANDDPERQTTEFDSKVGESMRPRSRGHR